MKDGPKVSSKRFRCNVGQISRWTAIR